MLWFRWSGQRVASHLRHRQADRRAQAMSRLCRDLVHQLFPAETPAAERVLFIGKAITSMQTSFPNHAGGAPRNEVLRWMTLAMAEIDGRVYLVRWARVLLCW